MIILEKSGIQDIVKDEKGSPDTTEHKMASLMS
jgi:hypothetical protein